MRMYDIIEKKRSGNELLKEEIDFFVNGYTCGDIPDYQASALLMAIYFKGMSKEETANLTFAMRDSGSKADLSLLGDETADKHSSGGVGDKTTLIVAPIAASLGCKVAKMSGRGLGHTGGTIDKLESIPGYNTSLTMPEFLKAVQKCGISVVGQTGNFAPADKKLYALRDVTATVDCLPLIASSIMSKKLAAGSKNIVLDVKVGSGAFMKNNKDAEALARTMVDIGKAAGKNTAAVLTNMDSPLGFAVGNSLEVAEAVACLKNADIPDLKEVCISLAAQMVHLSLNIPYADAVAKCIESLESGKAYKTFLGWIKESGGDISFADNIEEFTKANNSVVIKSKKSGYVSAIDALAVGKASALLGAGRAKKGDSIDLSAGVVLFKKIGDKVEAGEPLARLQSSAVSDFSVPSKILLLAFSFSKSKPGKPKMIIETIN